jgi:endonuclease YncB( thermonuclease family)
MRDRVTHPPQHRSKKRRSTAFPARGLPSIMARCIRRIGTRMALRPGQRPPPYWALWEPLSFLIWMDRPATSKAMLWLGVVLVGATACVADSEAGGPTGARSLRCTVERVLDGNTLRCLERDLDGRAIDILLAGVSARKRDGSCSLGHPCPAASAEAAIEELERLALGRTLTCRTVDTTDRQLMAFCQRADGTDLSCAMVSSGTTLLWERYWRDHRCAEPPNLQPEPIMREPKAAHFPTPDLPQNRPGASRWAGVGWSGMSSSRLRSGSRSLTA